MLHKFGRCWGWDWVLLAGPLRSQCCLDGSVCKFGSELCHARGCHRCGQTVHACLASPPLPTPTLRTPTPSLLLPAGRPARCCLLCPVLLTAALLFFSYNCCSTTERTHMGTAHWRTSAPGAGWWPGQRLRCRGTRGRWGHCWPRSPSGPRVARPKAGPSAGGGWRCPLSLPLPRPHPLAVSSWWPPRSCCCQ